MRYCKFSLVLLVIFSLYGCREPSYKSLQTNVSDLTSEQDRLTSEIDHLTTQITEDAAILNSISEAEIQKNLSKKDLDKIKKGGEDLGWVLVPGNLYLNGALSLGNIWIGHQKTEAEGSKKNNI